MAPEAKDVFSVYSCRSYSFIMKSARRLENPEICMQFAINMTLNLFNAGWSLAEGSLSAVFMGRRVRHAM